MRRLWVLSSALCALALPLWAGDVSSSAQVLTVAGKVEFQLPAKSAWHKVKTGMELAAGDRARTGETGKLGLMAADGTKVSLGPNTEILIASVGSSGAKRTALRLFRGLVRAIFKASDKGSRLDLYNENAVAAVKGTDLQVESEEGGKLAVKVFSSEHEGVLLSSWKDFHERMIRPGEEGDFGKDGLNFRALSEQDLKDANGFSGLPRLETVPTPPAEPPVAVTAKQRLKETVAALVPDKKAAAALVEKALQSGMSGAMLERVIGEKKGEGGEFSQIAKDQGLGSTLEDMGALIPTVVPTVPPSTSSGQGPVPTAAPTPSASSGQAQAPNQLLQDAQQALSDIRDNIVANSKQDQALKQNDLLQGNTFLDRQGYRVVLSHVVAADHKPNEVKIFDFSQRQDGPNTGYSVFGHDVLFNQDLPADWTTVYKRPLNDPANLTGPGGSPNYYRTQEFVSAASPGNVCSVCLSHSYGIPALNGGIYGQAHQDFYSVNGLPKGQQSFDLYGALQAGSDTITITPQQTGDQAWQLVYFNQTTNLPIFTAKVWLLNNSGSLRAPGSFGSGLTHLGGFGPADAGLSYELELSAPAFGGKDVDVVVPSTSFEEALR